VDLRIREKVAVVTGGSAGIGLAVARGLAAEGARLVLCGRDAERLAEAAAQVRDESGVPVLAVSADVATVDGVQRLVDAVGAEYGGADILINNAGTGSEETILTAPDERWQAYWELHVMAAVRLARSLAPGMRARGGGVILHNASICATQPLGHEPIYNVTKAALVMFSKCLAGELIGDGIRVNTVNPGLVLTKDWELAARERTAGTGESWQEYLRRYAAENAPIGRFATPAEVADLFVFLCSPRASYCVGSTFYVDGGWLNVTT
jgi:NAD(P)-dependent dehydrogenase (short-subunit alcohol dehydrogenase family)